MSFIDKLASALLNLCKIPILLILITGIGILVAKVIVFIMAVIK